MYIEIIYLQGFNAKMKTGSLGNPFKCKEDATCGKRARTLEGRKCVSSI